MQRIERPLTILFAIAAFTASAQELTDVPDQREFLSKGWEFEQGDSLERAVEWYLKVNPNDSLYPSALFQRSIIAFGKEKYDDALALSREGYGLHASMESAFGKNIAYTLAKQKKYDEADAWIDRMLSEFPANSEVAYTKGLVLEEEKKYSEAIAQYEDVARKNPFYYNVHRRLSTLAINEGKTTQAALALFFSIYIHYGDETANTLLGWGNEFLRGSVDVEPKNITIDANEDFSELDLLVQNRVAMQKNYKAVPNIDLAFARQLHLIVDQLAQLPEQTGFWSSYYVPVYLKLKEEGLFEGFIYHLLANSSSDDHLKMVKKNQAKVDLFRSRAARIVEDLHCTWPDSIGGAVRPVRHIYNNEQDLAAVGDVNDAHTDMVGDARFFHGNGRLSDEGRFDDQGRKQGEWRRYHENGRLKAIEHYVDGEGDGWFKEYYDNGAPEDSGTVSKGKFTGNYSEFKRNGSLARVRRFDSEGANGPSTLHFDNGATSFSMELKNGDTHGTVTGLYADGAKKLETTYVDGKKTGTTHEYLHDGRKESDYTYVDGEANGHFTNWHPNGQVATEGENAHDLMIGEVKRHALDGTLMEVKHFDDHGEWHGLYSEYDTDGKLLSEQDWNHGVLMKFRYFDKAGAVIHEAQRQKGAFDFKGYNPFGTLTIDGRYLASKGKEGEWKYYWPDGTLSSIENFNDTKEDGISKSYYGDGKLRNERRMVEGEAQGGYRFYHGNGQVMERGYRKAGEVHGQREYFRVDGSMRHRDWCYEGALWGWSEFFDPAGKLTERDKYEDGALTVIELYNEKGERYQVIDLPPGEHTVIENFPDGKKKSERTWLNGYSNGAFKSWHPNGKLAVEGAYLNDEQHGTWKYYNTAGKLTGEYNFVLGAKNGTWKQWFDNGKPKLEETWDLGYQTGDRVWYYENGSVLSRVPFLYGNEHGEGRYYTENGDLELVRYYRLGVVIGYSYTGADGRLVPMIPIENETVHIVAHYANGQVSRDMHLRNGMVDGEFLEFYPDGKPLEKSSYSHGQNDGLDEEWYANGQLYRRFNYIDGDADGEFEEHWENGKLREKGTCTGGEKQGTSTIYDMTGKAIELRIYRNDDIIRIEKPR